MTISIRIHKIILFKQCIFLVNKKYHYTINYDSYNIGYLKEILRSIVNRKSVKYLEKTGLQLLPHLGCTVYYSDNWKS